MYAASTATAWRGGPAVNGRGGAAAGAGVGVGAGASASAGGGGFNAATAVASRLRVRDLMALVLSALTVLVTFQLQGEVTLVPAFRWDMDAAGYANGHFPNKEERLYGAQRAAALAWHGTV
jgi:hypothetical protein